MPITIDYTGNLGAIGRALAAGAAIQQARQNANVAFEQQQQAQRTNIAQQVANRGDAEFQWTQQNALAQRQHAADMLRLNYSEQAAMQDHSLSLLPQRLDFENAAKLDFQQGEYTAEQQRQLSALDQSEAMLASSDEFTPEQKSAFKEQIAQRRLAIRSAGALSAQTPTAQEVAAKKMFVGQDGLTYSVDHNGDIRQHPAGKKEAGQLTETEMLKHRSELRKSLTTMGKDGTLIPPTQDELDRAMLDDIEWLATMRGATGSSSIDQIRMRLRGEAGQSQQSPPAPQQSTPGEAVSAANAQIQRMARQEFLFPSGHPMHGPEFEHAMFESKVPGQPSMSGRTLAMIAERTNTPIDQVIQALVKLPQSQAPAATQTAPAPGNFANSVNQSFWSKPPRYQK